MRISDRTCLPLLKEAAVEVVIIVTFYPITLPKAWSTYLEKQIEP